MRAVMLSPGAEAEYHRTSSRVRISLSSGGPA